MAMVVIAGLFAAGTFLSARIIHYRKLVVITFTILNNVLLVLAFLLALVGIVMASSKAFLATEDLSYIVGSVSGGP
jgi:hypothetical protein